jgi:glycosyltransferase involved in cell wall biosynthesis
MSYALSVSVVVPLLDETESFTTTVETVMAQNTASVHEVIVVVSQRTSSKALECAQRAVQAYDTIVWILQQRRPFLGGAMQDAFAAATGSHVLMMSSDLETDPCLVKTLIAQAQQGYDIVTATRWGQGGAFAKGYNPAKFVLNWGFQRLFGSLYGTPLTDLTYGFRIFRAPWVKDVVWEEMRHPFLLETLLKPLRLGAKVVEIPCVWRARTEGVSHNSFLQTFAYVPLALRTRLRPRRHLMRAGANL